MDETAPLPAPWSRTCRICGETKPRPEWYPRDLTKPVKSTFRWCIACLRAMNAPGKVRPRDLKDPPRAKHLPKPEKPPKANWGNREAIPRFVKGVRAGPRYPRRVPKDVETALPREAFREYLLSKQQALISAIVDGALGTDKVPGDRQLLKLCADHLIGKPPEHEGKGAVLASALEILYEKRLNGLARQRADAGEPPGAAGADPGDGAGAAGDGAAAPDAGPDGPLRGA